MHAPKIQIFVIPIHLTVAENNIMNNVDVRQQLVILVSIHNPIHLQCIPIEHNDIGSNEIPGPCFHSLLQFPDLVRVLAPEITTNSISEQPEDA